jgi:hypothetical protein
VSWPRPAPRPRPRPCCVHGAGPGTCTCGADGVALLVVTWRTCSYSAASCAVNVALMVVSVFIMPLYVAAALARLMIASTVSCLNEVVAAFAV